MPRCSKYYLAKKKKRIKEELDERRLGRRRREAEVEALTDEEVLSGEHNKTSKYTAIKRAERGNPPTATFQKLKNMSVAQYLILTGKVTGKNDKEIAEQLDCHVSTVQRERKKLQSSDWVQDVVVKVLDLADIWVESMRVNLLQGNPIVTIAYGRGIGALKDKHEITHKVDRKEQQKKFVEQMESTLGLKAKQQVEDTLDIDLEKDVVDEQ